MARYLSTEWVAAFDAALATLDLSDVIAAAGASSLAAADGTFSVAQMVTGVPGADGSEEEVRVVLTVSDGRAHLELDPGHARASSATIVLGYGDALAMARGELDPADALGRRGVCVCGATWRRWSRVRTCWPRPRPGWARTSWT